MQITSKNKIDRYYTALVDKDPQFIGIFFAAIKTTGIFCISTCRARKPKFENVLFYSDSNDALKEGFRPCKICTPTNYAFEPISEVKDALSMLKESPLQKVSDFELDKAGLKPDKIRRWFKKHHGITFQAYQRMIRINTAFQELKNGKTVTSSAFDSGYNSLSGFGYTFKTLTGKSPRDSKDKAVILISKLATPLGPMFVCATNDGICLLEFTDRRMLETEFRDLQKRLNAVILIGENEHTKLLKKELSEYFDGTRFHFTVPLHTPGTLFQNKVWNELKNIPFGQTRSYQEQAVILEKPKAVRAVASANGNNRIAIVIPCHRVIGKNGHLTGYSGGLARKKWLLEHEVKYAKVKLSSQS